MIIHIRDLHNYQPKYCHRIVNPCNYEVANITLQIATYAIIQSAKWKNQLQMVQLADRPHAWNNVVMCPYRINGMYDETPNVQMI